MRALRFAFLALPLFALQPSCFNPEYGSPGYYCHTGDDPACPEGQSCVAGRCVNAAGDNPGGATAIPKTGMYSGPTVDPMLSDASMCPDAALEPNDSIATAISDPSLRSITVDGAPLKLGNLSICPKGDNPKANGHDVDYYEIATQASVSAVVEITYDIKYGDLDVGIFRPDGSLVASDGSAVSNGCAAASLQAGTYYVAVVGANNNDVNRYQLSIRLSSTPKSCPTP